MSRQRLPTVGILGGFPRVSGDEPLGGGGAFGGAVFSPRERG